MRHRADDADRLFLAAFESGDLPPTAFDHRAHVRLAYVQLVEHPEDALDRLRSGLRAFMDHHGLDPAKYHETLTRAWLLAVRHFMASSPPADSAGAFIEANPTLLDAAIMRTHYSAERLFSDEARAGFVEPDLAAIPRYRL